MKRIKTLVAAASVAALLSALPATAAATGGLSAAEYPATLSGKPTGGFTAQIPGVGTIPICAPGFNATLNSSSATLTPSSMTMGTCEGLTWTLNGCNLTFNPGPGLVSLEPFGCGPLKIPTVGCGSISIESPMLRAKYTNSGETVQVQLEGQNVKFSRTFGGLCGPAESGHNLSIYGTWTISATNSKGKAIKVSATGGNIVKEGELPVDIQLATKAIGGEASGARVAADLYPMKVIGERHPSGTVTVLDDGEGNVVTCNGVSFDSGTLAAAAYGQIAFGAVFTNCVTLIGGAEAAATIKMNGCSFVFSELGEANEGGLLYNGSVGISCKAESERMEILGPLGCTAKIPPQSLSAEPEPFLENSPGDPFESVVVALMSGTGMEYTTNFACKLGGFNPGSNGTIQADLLLRGLYLG